MTGFGSLNRLRELRSNWSGFSGILNFAFNGWMEFRWSLLIEEIY